MGSPQTDGIDKGLAFFGKMSASVSHEIKNCLAIINENAGLLEDFSMMAEQGMPVDPLRLKTLSEKLKKQVRRANLLVLNLNRLAHSGDLPARQTTLGDSLNLMCALAQRPAAMQEVSLKPSVPDSSATFSGYAFHLNQLIWYCIEYAIETAEKGSTLEITLNRAGDAIRILFQPLEASEGSLNDRLLQAGPVKELLAGLRATLRVDMDQAGLELAFMDAPPTG